MFVGSIRGPELLPILLRLKQRRIDQWAIGFFAGAWLVLEVLDMIAEQFLWPAWIRQAASVLVLPCTLNN